jgi:uncharacterized membrane protein
MEYGCEAAIGAVCGLRAFMGPALTAGAANRKMLDLKKTPLRWMATEKSATTIVLLAAGELLADKLPFMPSRTRTPSLLLRFVSGAVCASAISNGRKRNEKIMGAIVGGTAAVAAAFVGYQYRRLVKMPSVAKALLEDTVAVGVGNAVITHVCN